MRLEWLEARTAKLAFEEIKTARAEKRAEKSYLLLTINKSLSMTTTRQRLVLDTNTLISAFTNEKSSSASFFRQVRVWHQLLASADTVAELLRVIQKSKVNKT